MYLLTFAVRILSSAKKDGATNPQTKKLLDTCLAISDQLFFVFCFGLLFLLLCFFFFLSL